jgi:intraflagellar transport protein 172
MWQDALRVCKEYIPHKLQHLQDEYEREMADKGGQRSGFVHQSHDTTDIF